MASSETKRMKFSKTDYSWEIKNRISGKRNTTKSQGGNKICSAQIPCFQFPNRTERHHDEMNMGSATVAALYEGTMVTECLVM